MVAGALPFGSTGKYFRQVVHLYPPCTVRMRLLNCCGGQLAYVTPVFEPVGIPFAFCSASTTQGYQ